MLSRPAEPCRPAPTLGLNLARIRQWMSSGKQSPKRRSNNQPNRDRAIEICLTRSAAFNSFQAAGRLFVREQGVIFG